MIHEMRNGIPTGFKGRFLRIILSTDDRLRGYRHLWMVVDRVQELEVQPDQTDIWRNRKIRRVHDITHQQTRCNN